MWGTSYSFVAIFIAVIAVVGAYFLMRDSFGQLW
jgi:hypothetical protein